MSMKTPAFAAALTLLGSLCNSPVLAAPALFRDADLALGARLVADHRCSECHVRRVGGDGNSIYNPKGRINTPAALRGMVDLCSTELKLQLFPEEVTAIAAVLNRDHYRFP
jgi:mono/diheme cytochrome c family protein